MPRSPRPSTGPRPAPTGAALGMVLGLALSWAAGHAAAGPRVLTDPGEQAAWSAVGRLNLSGAGHCTATLIDPGHVVTAAHCVFNPRTLQPVPPGRIHFLAGYRKGEYLAHRTGAAVAVSPEYRPTRKGSRTPAAMLSQDVAVIRLASPIEAVAPIPLSAAFRDRRARLRVLSYGGDRPEALSVEADCAMQGRMGDALITDCDAVPGVSGAPLIAPGTGAAGREGAEVVGVVSGVALPKGAQARLPLGAAANGVPTYAAAVDRLGPILKASLKDTP